MIMLSQSRNLSFPKTPSVDYGETVKCTLRATPKISYVSLNVWGISGLLISSVFFVLPVLKPFPNLRQLHQLCRWRLESEAPLTEGRLLFWLLSLIVEQVGMNWWTGRDESNVAVQKMGSHEQMCVLGIMSLQYEPGILCSILYYSHNKFWNWKPCFETQRKTSSLT